MQGKIVMIIGLWTGLAACGGQGGEEYPEGIRHVVVIGVDGMSPDGIRKAETPVMDSMIAQGAVKWNVRTVLPTSSSPNWASMIMGAGPEQHGVISNDWERDEHSLPPVTMGGEGIFPTIFGVIRESRPGAEIGAVYHWRGFGRLFEKEAVNYDRNFGTEDSTALGFAQYLVREKPLFAFVHFDHVDHAGHHDGHGSPAYYRSVAKADSLIGLVLESIREAGMAGNTLVIVTADHGGKGYGHGGPTVAEGEIAMIFWGKGIKQGYEIRQEVYTYDLAATIAFALKIVPPYAWIGRPVKSAFEDFPEPANLWEGKKVLASPVIHPEGRLYQQAGGLYVDKKAEVRISGAGKGDVIRYTLDGAEPGPGSTVYGGPFYLDSTAVVKARIFDQEGNASLSSVAYFRLLRQGGGNGVKVFFYPGNGWKTLPEFDRLQPAGQWISHEFSFDRRQLLALAPEDHPNFGLTFSSFLKIDRTGDYTFYLQSDDGSKLFIDNEEVVDNDGSHGVMEASGTIRLERGKHPVRVEYFNELGGFWLDVFYQGPGLAKQLIPADRLYLEKS